MKKILIASLSLLALVSSAFGADIADTAWNDSNLKTLQAFGKADVTKFVNSGRVKSIGSAGDSDATLPDDIQEFTWADLYGDRRYELVMVLKSFNRGAANSLAVYTQEPSGKVSEWWLRGMKIQLDGWKSTPYIPKVIEDLKGDGKYELIIPQEFGRVIGYRARSTWPRIYKREDGKFVDASREFAAFYEQRILPEYDRLIAKAREELAHSTEDTASEAEDNLTGLIMARDKVLRVTGRDPKAGEQLAREWIRGPNSRPLDAIAVFRDMGGHQAEVRAAMSEMHQELDPEMKELAAKNAAAKKRDAAKRAAALKKAAAQDQ